MCGLPVGPVRPASTVAAMSGARTRPPTAARGRPLIGLVGCVKTKLGHASLARDLYVSPMFLDRRAAVEGRVGRWFILSAEYGLVEPDQLIDTYDKTLANMSRQQRREWSSTLLAALRSKLGDLRDYTFEIHAGADYFDYGLRDGLREVGADVVVPTEGLRFGEQREYYAGGRARSRQPARKATRSTANRGKYGSIEQLLLETEGDELRVTFVEVERLLGRPLPPSARRHPAWWHSLASANGWRASPRLSENAVRFRRRAR